MSLNPQYITDSTGKKISVVLPIEAFEKMLEELEELREIELYDEARASKELSIPIDEAFKIIEAERENKV